LGQASTSVLLLERPGGSPPPVGSLSPPDHLSPAAAELWSDLIVHHREAGTITNLDLVGLEVLCETYADWCQARQELAESDRIYYGEKGPQVHPAFKILRSTEASLRIWLAEYGMTPLARARLKRPSIPMNPVGAPVSEEIDLSQFSEDELAVLQHISEGRALSEMITARAKEDA
jgi:P27 family predicted phage terminase small subunit